MRRKSTKAEATFFERVANKFPAAIQTAENIFIPFTPDIEYGMSDGRTRFKRWDSNK